ncbi:MAG: hypothetical protein ABIP02_08865, partial [Arenimonas sp.]
VHRVRLGDVIEGTGWRLIQLEPRRAVLEGPTGQRSMDLLVFNGKGGEAPTAVATATTNDNTDGATAVPVQAAPVNNAPAVTTAAANQNMTQEQQIEAIRQRIAARRAQMQADAAKAAADAKK